ncbi:MAG: glycosyltransferase family 2 protein [Planctomycetes bacterium]|nr:glycosyltransferase family 2 protein [Planctomycetota bacterium]
MVIRACTRTDDVLRLIDAIAHQSRRPDEVVVIDSGSVSWVTTRLQEMHETGIKIVNGDPKQVTAPVTLKLIEIPQGQFQSSRALNQAIEETGGEFIAIISQDAKPADGQYLGHLADSLEEDENLAGVYGRQILDYQYYPLGDKDLSKTYPKDSRTQAPPDCCFDFFFAADLPDRRGRLTAEDGPRPGEGFRRERPEDCFAMLVSPRVDQDFDDR